MESIEVPAWKVIISLGFPCDFGRDQPRQLIQLLLLIKRDIDKFIREALIKNSRVEDFLVIMSGYHEFN